MLLKYVSKSQLKKMVDDFDPHENAEKLTTLKNAISAGDSLHPVFFDDYCEIWLTYLFMHEEIRMDDFLQAYLYLLALKQCTDLNLTVLNKQDLQYDDEMLSLYTESLAIHYPHVSIDEIKEACLSFSGINSWFMVISATDADAFAAKSVSLQHSLLFDLNTPPVYPYFGDRGETNCVTTPIRIIKTQMGKQLIVPPLALVQWLIKKYNPESLVKLTPIFGRLTDLTVYEDFHRVLQHPANLNSIFVKNNLLEAHGCTGPLSLAVHDIYYHYLAMALIPNNILNFMMTVVMQALKELFIGNPLDAELNEILTLTNSFELPSDTLHPEKMLLDENKLGSVFADYLVQSLKIQGMKLEHSMLLKFCNLILRNPQTEFNINKKEFLVDFLSCLNIKALFREHSMFSPSNQKISETGQGVTNSIKKIA